MEFTERYIVSNFGIVHTSHSIQACMGDGVTHIELRPIREDELKEFYEKDDWVANVRTVEHVSDRVTDQFLLLPKERTPAVVEVTTRVGRRIHEAVERTLRLCRWRTGVYSDHNVIRCSEGLLQRSLNTQDSQTVGTASIIGFGFELRATPFDQNVWEQVGALARKDVQEPVSHELLREAWSLQSHSPRSALILGVSALEVGVKEFITDLVPHSEWLCFEVPSPPVVRILQDYLPHLPVRQTLNGEAVMPDVIVSGVKKLISQRNRVTHRGDDVATNSQLTDSLSVVQATLYLLDFYRGHLWAINNIHHSEVSTFIRERLNANVNIRVTRR